MCVNYRATRAELDAIARRAGADFGEGFREWKRDIWPAYDAPAVQPAGTGAAGALGAFAFWPKFM